MVAVDCCEGGEMYSYKGSDHDHSACNERVVERGNKNAANLEVITTCCDIITSVDALVGDILRLYGKGQFARAAEMDLRAQCTIITILMTTRRI
eukprot:scaffold167334_cov34-Attheya_sp.AAC.1